jgi:hypothetical protein
MVSISRESTMETDDRLNRIITHSRVTFYQTPFSFEEFDLGAFQTHARADALALVRDDRVWSQLVPRAENGEEIFAIWRFHFPVGVDNSGFVGWLASHLKQSFGTGVFVICGQNSKDGGIFDYWGCPWSLKDAVYDEIKTLVAGGGKS